MRSASEDVLVERCIGGCEKCIRDGKRSTRSCVKEGLLEGCDDVMSRLAARPAVVDAGWFIEEPQRR